MTAPGQVRCASCGTEATGNFCPACGSRLVRTRCHACGANLDGTSRFCPACGTPAGAASGRQRWNPAAITWGLVALAAVGMAWAAFGRGAPRPAGPAASAPSVAEPDLSSLSPRDQFAELADRVETAMESNDSVSIVRYFPMAEAAYARLTSSERDVDAHFHIGLLRARIGHFGSADAQIDTIVAAAPTHLFADYLRAIIADFRGDTAAAGRARAAFRQHYPAEMARNRPEYRLHRTMLDNFYKAAAN